MGLAAPKNKNKISNDPNNTQWSRSTTNFGHRVLTSQGWTPGSTLGVQNAPYAEHFTAGSVSHIRVVLKEDNLGLGAKKGSGQMAGQCVGLDVFQGILGRLNGKSDEVLKKEDDARGNLHRVAHIERRFGMISFVKGGLLVGDKIQALIDGEAQRVEAMKVASSTVEVRDDSPKDSTELKKFKRNKKGTDQRGPDDGPESGVTTKKGKKRRRTGEELSSPQSADDEAKASVRHPKSHDDRDKEKEAKRQRKLERHTRREAKRVRKEAGQSSKPHISSIETTTRNVSEEESSTKVERNIEIGKVPLFSARHAVRQRNIQHKRMAVMDSKSLNEIFMIKT